MHRHLLFCLIGFLLVPAGTSRADMIVEIQDVTLTSGGQGHVDVYVRSTGTDLVQFANYTFVIAPEAGQVAPGKLTFNPIQTFLDQNSINPRYIFAPDTDAAVLTKSLVSSTRLTGFDFTSSSQNVTIDSNRLLTRLELIHEGEGLEGRFTISLVNGNAFSSFLDADGNDVPIVASSFTDSGLITASISAVPEPSTWLLTAGLMTAVAARRRRRHARRA